MWNPQGVTLDPHDDTGRDDEQTGLSTGLLENDGQTRRVSSARAHTSHDGCSTDEVTLTDNENDDHDVPLTAEELSFHDPLDGKEALHNQAQDFSHMPRTRRFLRWVAFARTLQWDEVVQKLYGFTSRLARPRGRGMANEEEVKMNEGDDDEDDEAAGLLNNEWNSWKRLRAAGETTVSWAVWPLPSYTHRWFTGGQAREEVHRPTDYLDGLRGVASLFVFFDHFLVGLKDDLVQYGFGADGHYNIIQLPFLRTVFSGSAMVAIFFVISGYVLSARCIVAARANKHDKVHQALTSLVFRRGMRLFVPSLAASFGTLVLVFLGIMLPQHPVHWSVWRELHNYWTYIHVDLLKLWAWDISFKGWYSPQLWTIPLEFKCSMILFMVLVGTARCKVWARFLVTLSLLVYFFYIGRWDAATFIAGMIIAELNIIAEERRERREKQRAALVAAAEEAGCRPPQFRSRWPAFLRQLPFWAVLLLGFYLTGMPGNDVEHTPGYSWTVRLWPYLGDYKFRYWLAIAAVMVVLGLSFLPPAQAVFTTPVARYLGKISYALYLVHVMMNRTLRYFLWRTFWGVLKYETAEGDDAKFEGGWFLGAIIYVPCVLWAADVFWRAVDKPSVRFAKWVEGKCFVKPRPANA